MQNDLESLKRQIAELTERNGFLERKNEQQFADGFTLAVQSVKFQQLLVSDESTLIAAVDFANANKRTGLHTMTEINDGSIFSSLMSAFSGCKWSSAEIQQRVTHQLFVIVVDCVRKQFWMCHPCIYDHALAICAGTKSVLVLNMFLSLTEEYTLSSPCISWRDKQWSSGLIHAIRTPEISDDQICRMVRRATPAYLNHQTTYAKHHPYPRSEAYYLGNALSFAILFIRPSVVNELLSRVNPFLDAELVDPFDPCSCAERLILSLPPGDSENHKLVRTRLDELETLQTSYYGSLPAIIRAGLIESGLFIPELIGIVLIYARRLPHATARLILTNPIHCSAVHSDHRPPIPTAFPTRFDSE